MMKWSLSQLKKYRNEPFKINEQVDLTEYLKANNQDVRGASPVTVQGGLEMQGNDVVASLNISGSLVLPCARTLVDVVWSYEIHSIETFVTSKEDLQDESFHLMEKDTVDLTPVVEELLLVEIPMQVFSDEVTGSEELPQGKDWELKTEDDFVQEEALKKPKVDPRLAGLADFFDEKKDD